LDKERKLKAVTENMLSAMFLEVVNELRAKIRSGDAKPADIKNAIAILKDNGIQMVAEEDNELDKLAQSLPDFDFEYDETLLN
jgi:hypothetical protein